MKKPTSLLLLLCLLAPTLNAAAAPTVTANSPICAEPTSEDLAGLPDFEKEVQIYIASYYSGNRFQRSQHAARIRKQIFANPGSPQYLEGLGYLDAQASYAPEAIYDLARVLQLHWEAENEQRLAGYNKLNPGSPRTLSQRQDQRVQEGAKIGMDVGIGVALAAMGAICLFKPQAAPRWFSLLRLAYPVVAVAGLGAGVGTAQAMNATGFLIPTVPLSPAHVMKLGIQTDHYHYDDSTLVRDLTAFTVSAGVSLAVYNVLKAVRYLELANAAATPAKINPYALVISVVVGMVAEQGVVSGIDFYETWKLKGKLKDSRRKIDEAMAQQDGTGVYDGADALVHAAVNLTTYISRPLMEAVDEYTQSNAVAEHEIGQDAALLQDAINENTKVFSDQVQAIMDRMDQPADRDYQDSQLLILMQHGDEDQVADLSDADRSRDADYRAGFAAWLAREEQGRHVTLAADSDSFSRYIQSRRDEQDRALIASLREGDIPQHPTHVLLQAAALLRSTSKDYVLDKAEYLMTLIADKDRMIRKAIDEGAKIVLPPPREPLPEGGVPQPGSDTRGSSGDEG